MVIDHIDHAKQTRRCAINWLQHPFLAFTTRTLIVASCFTFFGATAYADEIRIGIRAHIGIEKSTQKWQETARYLDTQILGRSFKFIYYDTLPALSDAAIRKEFDFAITNPSSYIDMEINAGASRILTLKNKRQGKAYTQFGGVIFTRADQTDIQTIKDLRGKSLDATIVPFLDTKGKPFQYIAISTDITKRIEAEHREMMANQAKSEFLSSMSHELRTPMNAILGFAEVLTFDKKDPLSHAQKTSVTHIMESGKHLLELINRVLDLAKVESGKLKFTCDEAPLRPIVEECLQSLQTTIDATHPVKIALSERFSPDLCVYADAIHVRQSLLHFLTNAVKFNRENGTITIDCHPVEGDMIHLSITDTGFGIPNELLDELFVPFNREITNEKIGGTGIGLTITKKLIESMGGKIGVHSEIDKGSTFWIELPVYQPSKS